MFHLMIFILPSFIIALILNVPKWLEFEHISENITRLEHYIIKNDNSYNQQKHHTVQTSNLKFVKPENNQP